MEKNILLKVSLSGLVIVRLLMALIGAGTSIIWLAGYINPQSLQSISGNQNSIIINTQVVEPSTQITLADTATDNPFFFSLIMIEFLSYCIIAFIIISQFIKVIRSMNRLNTFIYGNVKAFRIIGFSLLVLTGLKAFDYSIYNDKLMLSLPVIPIAATCISFILAEVFKEGNRLFEENRLTI